MIRRTGRYSGQVRNKDITYSESGGNSSLGTAESNDQIVNTYIKSDPANRDTTIGDLLQDISSKLEVLARMIEPDDKGQNTGNSVSPQNGAVVNLAASSESKGTSKADIGNLERLFDQILQNNSQISQNTSGSENASQSVSSTTLNSEKAVKTASQVLAQAHYELANELDASLKKLRQVINESETIANKISSILEKENNSRG